MTNIYRVITTCKHFTWNFARNSSWQWNAAVTYHLRFADDITKVNWVARTPTVSALFRQCHTTTLASNVYAIRLGTQAEIQKGQLYLEGECAGEWQAAGLKRRVRFYFILQVIKYLRIPSWGVTGSDLLLKMIAWITVQIRSWNTANLKSGRPRKLLFLTTMGLWAETMTVRWRRGSRFRNYLKDRIQSQAIGQPTSAPVMISQFTCSAPAWGSVCWQLRARSLLQILCPPLSLCPFPTHTLCLSFSLENK